MSHQSSIINTLREVPTAAAIRSEHLISLVDSEAKQKQTLEAAETPRRGDETPAEEPERDGEPRAATRSNSQATTPQPGTPRPNELVKRITSNSLQMRQGVKRRLTERKYAKYGQSRYELDEGIPAPPDEDPASQPQHGEPASALQKSYLERSTAKAKAMWNRKKGMGRGKDTHDVVVDVLYENQRGTFFFGIPKYSSSSLLPSDPKPWQNAQFRTSPVDIRNAQVPDPSWEWAWKSWYVDMSRDVDEEGWEYSLRFTGSSSWHGNHPFFHSFVRRRRWLRMRKRRNVHRHHTKEKAHELTAEYFTIHPKTLKAASEDLSKVGTSEMAMLRLKLEEEAPIHELEMTDIAQLLRALKKASVDREKLVAVRKFIVEGGEETYYLADRIPEIMSLLIFQTSRRQLLADLIQHHDEARERRLSLRQHSHDDDDEEGQQRHEAANRHVANLMSAVEAADAQVRRLEYWSDIKGLAQQEGESFQAAKAGKGKGEWAGLTLPTGAHSEAFTSKQDAEEGAPRLHQHAEHGTDRQQADEQQGSSSEETKVERERSKMWDRLFPKRKEPQQQQQEKGKRKADGGETRQSSRASDSLLEAPPLERFTTAHEDASEIGSEADADDSDNENGSNKKAAQRPRPPNVNLTISQTLDGANDHTARSRSVQLVEPERVDDEEEQGGGAGDVGAGQRSR